MNKNIIKSYAMNLTKEDIINFGFKEGITVTEEEAELFLDTIKEDADYILDGHALEIIEAKKDKMSESAYNKLLELYDKYRKFID